MGEEYHRLLNKYVLITGSSGEIGQEIAKSLAKQGYSLYLHYHQGKQAILELMSQLTALNPSIELFPIQADLTTHLGCQRLCQGIFQLDGIVHNSGTSLRKLLQETYDEEVEKLLFLHLTAPILITKSLLPKLIQKKSGSIIFISSIWGVTGASYETVYSAAKGGQIAFAKALSKEVAPSGIRVNVVAPGIIQTKMNQFLNHEEIHDISAEIPLGVLGKPIDVANAVKFLLSDEASYITGQVINVNGGWYI